MPSPCYSRKFPDVFLLYVFEDEFAILTPRNNDPNTLAETEISPLKPRLFPLKARNGVCQGSGGLRFKRNMLELKALVYPVEHRTEL